VPSAKRERQKQGRAARQEAIRAAQQRRHRRRQTITFALLVATPIVILLATKVFGGDGGGDTAEVAATSKEAAPCPKLKDQERRTTFPAPQRNCIKTSKTYVAKVTTDVGAFTIELDNKRAPTTVNNFVVLSRYHFYDGLTFHRVVKDFVIQGGDPQGNGQGDAGYKFGDEGLDGVTYPAAAVAMANSGPNTNGSQFFIVTTDSGGKGLQPLYNRFGTITDGMDVVKKIEADPGVVGTQQPPATVHKILTIEIEEH
jgi:cyclophilin family peptidyl-prolyl cis-trans isomerase